MAASISLSTFGNLQKRENVNQINPYLQGNNSFVLLRVLKKIVETRIRYDEEQEIIHDGELM
jgi:hypothetical protein